jgi:hypothetical protein
MENLSSFLDSRFQNGRLDLTDLSFDDIKSVIDGIALSGATSLLDDPDTRLSWTAGFKVRKSRVN